MKIRKLQLATHRLTELKSFYKETLDLQTVTETPDSFSLQLPDTELVFYRHSGSTIPLYHYAFNIPSNKIEEAANWLADKTQRLFLDDYNSYIADFKNWKAKSVYFMDAAGNVVELIARFELDNAVNAPFSADQFLSVSEIGLVFPPTEMEQETQKLLTRFHLSFFNRQPPSKHFKAIGDDQGLFIIVSEGRAWYPTGASMAVLSPVKLDISVNDAVYRLEFNAGE